MKKAFLFIVNIALPLAIGAVSSFFTSDASQVYDNLIKPIFAPPGEVFPIIWTILYILMGISSYLVYTQGNAYKNKALKVYGLQLAMNFIWSILFFGFNWYLLSFFWILLLLVIISYMIYLFYNQNKLAGFLQIPLLIWVAFAGLLNLAIAILNF